MSQIAEGVVVLFEIRTENLYRFFFASMGKIICYSDFVLILKTFMDKVEAFLLQIVSVQVHVN